MGNSHPPEFMGRGTGTQLQVSEKLSVFITEAQLTHLSEQLDSTDTSL